MRASMYWRLPRSAPYNGEAASSGRSGVSRSAISASRSGSAGWYGEPVRMRRPGGDPSLRDARSSKRAGTSHRALRGNTRTSPVASRMRKPMARSSSWTVVSESPLVSFTLAR